MNKYSFLAIAAALSLSAKGYCTEVSFDQGVDVSGIIQQINTDKPFNGPQPGHETPGDHGGGNHPGDNHSGNDHGGFPGNHGGDNHPGDNHGGFPGDHGGYPGNNGWDHNHGGYPDNHHDQPYSPVYPDMNCTSWEFTSQTANTRTEDVTAAEQSFDCYMNGSTQYCRPTGNYLSRKVTVNIGARQLQSWEKESLKVCLDNGNTARLDISGMLYDYSVTSQDHDGFLGFGRSTTFNLTPGAKKPAAADAKEISVSGTSVGEGGALFMTIADARAEYYKGEQIDISLDGMRLPEIVAGQSAADLINSFVNIKVAGSFPVSPLYTIKLTDTPKPGKYVVTISFTRRGQLSSSEPASTIESFEVK